MVASRDIVISLMRRFYLLARSVAAAFSLVADRAPIGAVIVGTATALLPLHTDTSAKAVFSRSDYLLIVISGYANESRQWGYSAKASIYKRIPATNPNGYFVFSAVAENITAERNSSRDPMNTTNFGTGGYVPHGVYFLHYHRWDPSFNLSRHRLTISDRKCGETIKISDRFPLVVREGLQIHVAYTANFHDDVSEGCVTLSENNFSALFPPALLEFNSSPLSSCDHSLDLVPAPLRGDGNILVFITDVLTAGRQDEQLKLFKALVAGQAPGINASHFVDGGAIDALRRAWTSGAVLSPNPPSNLKPIP